MPGVVAEPIQDLLRHTLNFCNQRLDCGDLPGVQQGLGRALCLSPNDADILSQRGLIALVRRDFDAAHADFSAALGRDPRCAPACSGLARYHLERGNLIEAEKFARRALSVDPANEDATDVLATLTPLGPAVKLIVAPSAPHNPPARMSDELLELTKRLPSGEKWAFNSDPAAAAKIKKIVERVRPYTMVPDEAVVRTIELTIAAASTARDGDVIAECGTWRGGSSLAMILAQQEFFGAVKFPVWMFDSFEGLPEITKDDGQLAVEWQQQSHAPEFFNNCTAHLDEVLAMLKREGIAESSYRIFKGWFNQTVAPAVEELDRLGVQLALLRLDGDWYESTRDCLNALFPKLRKGAPCIVDDYYAWDGCALALHEYFGTHRIASRIRAMPVLQGAFFFNKVRDKLDEL